MLALLGMCRTIFKSRTQCIAIGSYGGVRAMVASMIAKQIALAESRKLLLVGCYTSAAYDETPSQFRDPGTPTAKTKCILCAKCCRRRWTSALFRANVILRVAIFSKYVSAAVPYPASEFGHWRGYEDDSRHLDGDSSFAATPASC